MQKLCMLASIAVLAGLALGQNVTTPVATKTPTLTPITTPVATPAAKSPPSSPALPLAPPALTTPPGASSPPPIVPSPPPPPGTGSSKTAVLTVMRLTGNGLQSFNSSLGDDFIDAMANIYRLGSSSILIRSWGSSGRRLLSDTVTVASAALFPNGVAAATGLSAVNTAANSGALQAALQEVGLDVESVALDSAVTALPSNFQPLYGSQHSRGLRTWAIVVIAVVGALLLVSVVFCCCRSCLCCCPSRVEEGEEKLPKMIKFGSWKGQEQVTKFNSTQRFTPTTKQKGKPLPEATMPSNV